MPDLTVLKTLTVSFPAALSESMIEGLSHRAGWKPSPEDPSLPIPINATKPAHRAHATYVREELPILDGQGNPTGQTQIKETWQPTRQELAWELAAELIWVNAIRGKQEKEQEELQAAKQTIDASGLISITES